MDVLTNAEILPTLKLVLIIVEKIVGLSEVNFDSTSETNGNSGAGNGNSGAADLEAADRSSQKSTCSEICRDNTFTDVFTQFLCVVQCKEAEDNDNIVEKMAFCENQCNNNKINPVKCRKDCGKRMGLSFGMKRQRQQLRHLPRPIRRILRELGITRDNSVRRRQAQQTLDDFLETSKETLGIDDKSIMERNTNGMFNLFEENTSLKNARKILLDILGVEEESKEKTSPNIARKLLLKLLGVEEESKRDTFEDQFKNFLIEIRKAQCPPWDPHCHDHGCPLWDPHCHDHGCLPWDHHCRHHQSNGIEILVPSKPSVGSSKDPTVTIGDIARWRNAQDNFWCHFDGTCEARREDRCLRRCDIRYRNDPAELKVCTDKC